MLVLKFMYKQFSVLFGVILLAQVTCAQFMEDFNTNKSPEQLGWRTLTGDGNIEMEFIPQQGYASVIIDATKDTRNLWWAVIRKEFKDLDLKLLANSGYELRSEVRIRVSHAPRRVNLHFNHSRTTDFHSQLSEYDIPDTVNWHTISFTTDEFDARPGDLVNAQMAMIDWGLRKFRLDIDYFKVDLIKTDTAGPDKGAKLPYHPPLEDPLTFKYQAPVVQNATLDTQFPEHNFSQWSTTDSPQTNLLHVGGNQLVVLRWDLEQFRNAQVMRSGLLELPVHSVQRSGDYPKDFGMVRISEIIGGKVDWNQTKATWASFSNGQPMDMIINEQMTIDYPILVNENGLAYFTISYPVLQRMIEGKTLGLSIKPLGAISASFYSADPGGKRSAKLYFDLKE